MLATEELPALRYAKLDNLGLYARFGTTPIDQYTGTKWGGIYTHKADNTYASYLHGGPLQAGALGFDFHPWVLDDMDRPLSDLASKSGFPTTFLLDAIAHVYDYERGVFHHSARVCVEWFSDNT